MSLRATRSSPKGRPAIVQARRPSQGHGWSAVALRAKAESTPGSNRSVTVNVCRFSVRQPRAKHDRPRRKQRSQRGDASVVRAGHVGLGTAPVRVIEEIRDEHIETRRRARREAEVLERGKVDVPRARSNDRALLSVAEPAGEDGSPLGIAERRDRKR
jgi:hypothetical protein